MSSSLPSSECYVCNNFQDDDDDGWHDVTQTETIVIIQRWKLVICGTNKVAISVNMNDIP